MAGYKFRFFGPKIGPCGVLFFDKGNAVDPFCARVLTLVYSFTPRCVVDADTGTVRCRPVKSYSPYFCLWQLRL
jgi:hypothetical protein